MKGKRTLFVMALVNVFILATPFFTTGRVINEKSLTEMSFGFPFSFIVQDQSGYSPSFPHNMTMASLWENPIFIDITSLFASLLTVYIIIVAVLCLMRRRGEGNQNEKKKQ